MRTLALSLHVFPSRVRMENQTDLSPDAKSHSSDARRSARALTALLSLGITLLIAPVSGFAATLTWQGGTGDWFTSSNWGCGVLCSPGSGDTAFIGGPAIGSVSLNGTANVADIALGNGNTGTLNVSTGGSLTSATQIDVGATNSGFLNITGGATVTGNCTTCSSGVLGFQTTGIGVATVSGIGSTWANASQLDVGLNGSGSLTITHGGTVSDNCSSCSAAVIGYNSGSNGFVQVSGAGSTWNNNGTGFLNVGAQGAGTLQIDTGGLVNAGPVVIGTQSQGTLAISSGGTLIDTSAFVGGFAGSYGNAQLNAGSWTNSGSLFIGAGGSTGYVGISDGGQLTAADTTVGSNGTLVVDPAAVDVNGDFTLSAGGFLSLGIGGTAPGSYSQLNITGSGFFDGTVDLDFTGGFAPQAGNTFNLINDINGVDLSQATIEIEGLAPGFNYSIANGELTALNNGVSDTPEPDSAWLLAGALSALLLAGASRKSLVRRKL